MTETNGRPKLRPGDKFNVQFSGDRTAEVVALSFLGKERLADLTLKVEDPPAGENPFRYLREGLTIAQGYEPTDEFLDTIDGNDAMEIMLATIKGAALNEDEKKKSE